MLGQPKHQTHAEYSTHMQGSLEGGFAGRTHKLVDGCYSFWQGGLFPLLQRLQPLISFQQGLPAQPAAIPCFTLAGNQCLCSLRTQCQPLAAPYWRKRNHSMYCVHDVQQVLNRCVCAGLTLSTMAMITHHRLLLVLVGECSQILMEAQLVSCHDGLSDPTIGTYVHNPSKSPLLVGID